ncbi:hypothetical protein IFM89_012973 [Coptis chinensis]|uniref:Glycosyltransferase family 92 protein n=1 Tax=Coptis chinensis TaxID=261450 RepID=A0A835IT80_9MAGN|nr:hypothetical protein IFM89_012973 [Coptis chinensis]
MQSDQQRRKRKQRFLKPPYFITSSYYYFVRCCILFLFLLFFLFFNGFTFESDFLFKSVLGVFRSTSVSLASSLELCPVRVEDWVLFPDHVLLLVSKRSRLSWLNLHGGLDCIYRQGWTNSSFEFGDSGKLVALPVLSVDEYNELQSIARCPLPPSNYSAMVQLRKRVIRRKDGVNNLVLVNQTVHSWEMLVYAAALDGETAVVFVKGLNLRPDRVSDPAQFSCHFDWNDSEKSGKYALNTNAVTAAQEIIRCSLPLSLKKYPTMAHGLGVSISIASHPGHRDVVGSRGRGEAIRYDPAIPSVAKIIHSEEQAKNKYELCACTMLWNQATSLREWIVYHAWLGVERWFIYDNNSNDGIEKVIEELNQEKFNVSRHVWPWIKSQEAGFSHCILKARRECKWVAFMDVDEFFYFPLPTANRLKKINLGYPGRHSLRSLVAKFSSSKQ